MKDGATPTVDSFILQDDLNEKYFNVNATLYGASLRHSIWALRTEVPESMITKATHVVTRPALQKLLDALILSKLLNTAHPDIMDHFNEHYAVLPTVLSYHEKLLKSYLEHTCSSEFLILPRYNPYKKEF